MKRTKTIKLLLLSASFAACNHGEQPAAGYYRDWVYAGSYPYPYFSPVGDSSSLYHHTLPLTYFNNWFYPGRDTRIALAKKGAIVRSARFVVRGGFGGRGFASS